MNKYIKAITYTLTYIIVLLFVYYIHMRFFRVDVVLYACIFDALIATILAAIGFIGSGLFRTFSRLEVAQLLVIWLLSGYVFAISVPTVIDRSLSFYILEKLQQRGGGIREDAFGKVFTEEYVREHHLVEVRLTEQLHSGTIEVINGCVKLTPRGYNLASFSRLYRKNFLPNNRSLIGRYTDDLTDPFRNSIVDVNYKCR